MVRLIKTWRPTVGRPSNGLSNLASSDWATIELIWLGEHQTDYQTCRVLIGRPSNWSDWENIKLTIKLDELWENIWLSSLTSSDWVNTWLSNSTSSYWANIELIWLCQHLTDYRKRRALIGRPSNWPCRDGGHALRRCLVVRKVTVWVQPVFRPAHR